MMKASPEAVAWAAMNRFSIFASAETIMTAYEAHQRILKKRGYTA